ncbi:MAG: cyclic nucleotide-binding domain-containing protein, partial [Chloroflexi bacterium]|nr:cyclic nucleotide-binding domain-containing protein [Chloroflexota bacterium]
LRPSMPAWGAAPDVDMSPAAFAPPRYAGEIEPPAPPTPAPTGARPNLGESRDQQLLSSLPTTGFTPADPDAAATLLRNGPIFRGVAEQPFLLMMHKLRRERLLQMRRYADGDEILRQGEDGNTLHFIIAGSVGVERTQPGGVTARLAELGAGELFGEMALLGDGHRTATVRAVGPVETLVILQDGVRQVLSGFPAASRPLLALLRARRAALEGM